MGVFICFWRIFESRDVLQTNATIFVKWPCWFSSWGKKSSRKMKLSRQQIRIIAIHDRFCQIELIELIWRKTVELRKSPIESKEMFKMINESTKLTTYGQGKTNVWENYSLTFVICGRKMFSSTTGRYWWIREVYPNTH